MLVHICCSVDSFYFLKKLKEQSAQKLIGFFYNPNIHPKEEHDLRALESRRSCEILGIDFIQGTYDDKSWTEKTVHLKDAPENAQRCELCFDIRMLKTAQKARELNEPSFTTTLLLSPKKDLKKLSASLSLAQKAYGVEFCFFDFRKNGGTNAQMLLAKEMKTYKQDYCGCSFALLKQREAQKKEAQEMYSCVFNKTLPNSPKARLELYQKRADLEARQIPYKIQKKPFLNYRLLYSKLSYKGVLVPSYVLAYSYSRSRKINLDPSCADAHFFTLKDHNLSFKALQEMSFEDEIFLRKKLGFESFDLSIVIFVQSLPTQRLRLELISKIFADTKETLVAKAFSTSRLKSQINF